MQKATVVTALITGIVVGAVVWLLAPRAGTLVTHPHQKKNCQTMPDCKIDITVDCGLSGITRVCEPYPDDAEVAQITSTTTALNFKIKTNGYYFDPNDGIKFVVDDPHDAPFTCPPVGANSDKFSCTVAGAKPTTLYKYSIHVVNLAVVDPWVVNY